MFCIVLQRIELSLWFGGALAYLIDLCQPVSGAQGSQPLCSAERGVLVEFALTVAVQNRAFSVAGPVVWNRVTLKNKLRSFLCGTIPVCCLS